ncbi:hypothetical protein AJ80_02484 [Polytolypa hystricis UAMH7299]|uniref:Major facilitator superfamily (MFS) profile domain-containing protein n=1 Tax=Polytolypa hystricis (strain UAMH7299) TaxID=1447883 RepID=A0A2B7YQT9_POLH7|nr:hypothetical protein AJ80_02484 [Polytolypa hystricis UAMH7299]
MEEVSDKVPPHEVEREAKFSLISSESAPESQSSSSVQVEADKPKESNDVEWSHDPHNPWNWTPRKKLFQVLMLCSMNLLASMATSITSPANAALMDEFNVSRIVAILPLTSYVLAMGFGPIIGGPLSETVGRYPVYVLTIPLGALFGLGAGFTHNFGALCFLRFLSGLCWGPVLAISSGSISDTFAPQVRGPVSAVTVLVPFLGPGLGPVIGSLVVSRKDWRWTQWTLLFLAGLSMLLVTLSEETLHPVIKRRLAKKRGQSVPKPLPLAARLRTFAIVGLIRPIRMLFLEPIVSCICLYIAAEFGTLFSFFAAVPYAFGKVYHFSLEQSGLVFLSIVIGCFIGLITIFLCEIFHYRKQIPRYPANRIPPEHRLYPAMIGSIVMPIGLFWYAWTVRSTISWASPAAAIIPFAWGNLLARYGFAGVFPLFTIQMYEKLGIAWASSLLGFIALVLMPIPWVLFKYGPRIRARSQYETIQYS